MKPIGVVRTILALALACTLSLPAFARTTFAIADKPYAFAWPGDHAAHPAYQTEWWYYTGHLRARDGRRFGYELTFFRFGLRPGDPPSGVHASRWRGTQLYPAHFALTDVAGRTFFHVERFAREALGMGRASTKTLDVAVGDWTLRGAPHGGLDRERMTLHASDESAGSRMAIDLVQVPQKAPAVHGAGGVSRKASCRSCASHYYSYTRLRTTGTLTYAGTPLAVDGRSWMDHEFGSSQLRKEQRGWDWFSLQLDDGRELMLYLLRNADGSVTPESSGSIVARDGSVRHLPLQAFSAQANGSWTSPHTGAAYPSGWRVRVPREGIDLTLTPQVLDQELAAAVGGSYWEGSVEVTSPDGRPVGLGYVELTGYAGGISL